MPGDEAEPLPPEQSEGGKTLCPRCAVLAQAADIKTVTEFSRWLRACGFSRSLATKIAGHGWPKGGDNSASDDQAAAGKDNAEIVNALRKAIDAFGGARKG